MGIHRDTADANTKPKKKGIAALFARPMRYAVATAAVLLTLLVLSAGFVLHVYFMTESSCYEKLSTETEDALVRLESNLRSDRTMLRVIAGLIGNVDDINSIEVGGYLTNYDFNSLITQIAVLLPDDDILLSKGRRSNTDETLQFAVEFPRDEHISAAFPANSSSPVIRNFVPIRKDGICIGLLYSSASSASIAKAWLPNIYSKKGCCCIVNRKSGEIIVNSSSDQIRNIHDLEFQQTDPSCTREDTIQKILNGKKGYSVFEMQSKRYYMCFLPFSVEDWEMVVYVPEREMFSESLPFRNGLYILLAVSSVLIAVYAIWILHEFRVSIAETEQKANIDVLTGLPNRNRYEAFLQTLAGSKKIFTCLFVDANGLHDMNNTKGHSAGDQMLRFIADSLKVQFDGARIFRIGGDEFVVFQTGKTENEIRESLSAFNEALQRNDYHAAVGSCIYESGMSVDELIENAEKEMYSEKQKYYEKIGKIMRA